MNVLNNRQSVITNSELLSLLLEKKKQQNALPKEQRLRVFGTVVYEVTNYLKSTPAANQTNDHIEKLIAAVEPYKLTAAEILQVINLRPSTPVEMQLIIEECEERLTVEQLESLVDVVKQTLPDPSEGVKVCEEKFEVVD